MNIYEFVTPSDPITFKTDDDKIAFVCALILGNGKAGCRNIDTDKSIPSFLLFSEDPEASIKDYIGADLGEFIEKNKPNIAECLMSFSYGSVSERKTFDDACNAITDPEKLIGFKAKHEDENRTSMSQYVKTAWNIGKKISEIV